jgi:hypothetical protein
MVNDETKKTGEKYGTQELRKVRGKWRYLVGCATRKTRKRENVGRLLPAISFARLAVASHPLQPDLLISTFHL